MGKKTSVEDLLKADGKLKELRKRRNLIQEQLADEIGTSQQTVSRVEKDKLSMSIETLIRLTVYFNVSADELVQLYRGLNERDKELVYSQVKRMHELDRKKKN